MKEFGIFPSVTFPGFAVNGNDNSFYISLMGSGNLPMESCIIKINMNGDLVTGFGDDGILRFNAPVGEQITKLAVNGKHLYSFFFPV